MAVEELQQGDGGRVCDCSEDADGRGRACEEGDIVFCEDGAVEVDAVYWAARDDHGCGT